MTDVDAVVQQIYPGEPGGLAVAEIIFGAVNPSSMYDDVVQPVLPSILIVDVPAGKLPVSFPGSVATTPVFYNYLKGTRPVDPGMIYPNGSLLLRHQVNIT